jgi:hypothetical protein
MLTSAHASPRNFRVLTLAVSEPHRIRHFRIALSQDIELPWTSRAPLLDRLREHDAGLQVVLAFEAVGAT